MKKIGETTYIRNLRNYLKTAELANEDQYTKCDISISNKKEIRNKIVHGESINKDRISK